MRAIKDIIGKMDKRINVYQRSNTDDGMGGSISGYQYIMSIWCEIKDLSSQQRLLYGELANRRIVSIRLRKLKGYVFSNSDKFMYNNDEFYINSIAELENDYLNITAYAKS
jgi:head-tail adaptor